MYDPESDASDDGAPALDTDGDFSFDGTESSQEPQFCTAGKIFASRAPLMQAVSAAVTSITFDVDQDGSTSGLKRELDIASAELRFLPDSPSNRDRFARYVAFAYILEHTRTTCVERDANTIAHAAVALAHKRRNEVAGIFLTPNSSASRTSSTRVREYAPAFTGAAGAPAKTIPAASQAATSATADSDPSTTGPSRPRAACSQSLSSEAAAPSQPDKPAATRTESADSESSSLLFFTQNKATVEGAGRPGECGSEHAACDLDNAPAFTGAAGAPAKTIPAASQAATSATADSDPSTTGPSRPRAACSQSLSSEAAAPSQPDKPAATRTESADSESSSLLFFTQNKATVEGAGRPGECGSEHAACDLDGLTDVPPFRTLKEPSVSNLDPQHSPPPDVSRVLGAAVT